MKKIMTKIIEILICLIFWWTISPLFYYLSGRFELISKKWRIGLLLISPFCFSMFAFLTILGLYTYDGYHCKYRFADNKVIERITEASFPKVKIRQYKKGPRSLTGDYSDQLILKMDSVPGKKMKEQLEGLCKSNKNWSKKGDRYTFNRMWGNDLPAPRGEDDDEDMTFFLEYNLGTDILELNYGAW